MLRPLWDEELGNADNEGDPVDKMRLEWRTQLDLLEASVNLVMSWVRVKYKGWSYMDAAAPPRPWAGRE